MPTGQKIYICSDSQVALKAIRSIKTGNSLVQESSLGSWAQGRELARLGAEDTCIGPEPFLKISRQQISSALNVWAHKAQLVKKQELSTEERS